MPMVRIAVPGSLDKRKIRIISDSIHTAMVETIGIPEGDRFHVISRHDADTLIFDSSFLTDSPRTSIVLIHILLRLGRTLHIKQLLYHKIADRISTNAGISLSDIMIVLSENDLDDWSFSGGKAQYIEDPTLFARRKSE